jgi:hypothetical protein
MFLLVPNIDKQTKHLVKHAKILLRFRHFYLKNEPKDTHITGPFQLKSKIVAAFPLLSIPNLHRLTTI